MDEVADGAKIGVDPEGLLRSALEKIVFFECRVSQLESELAAARTAAERARADASSSRRLEVELEQANAAEKGARADAERRAAEMAERIRLLEAERERLLGGLVERARVAGAPGSSGEPAPEEGGADLAGFIAELRAEIDSLRAFRAAAEAAGFRDEGDSARPSTGSGRAGMGPTDSVSTLAGRFEASGRVGLTGGDAARMKELLATRADRALYERSMDDLGAPDAGRRLRAVRALEALGSKAAAPLLAAALGRDPDPAVKAAVLSALAHFGEPFSADLATRELADARPSVRVAALETLAAVAGSRAEEPLAAALADPSPLVRRRAALLLGFAAGERAEEALAAALGDRDRGVARAAAAALSGRPSARAQGALARGLEHADPSVRRAAASALTRLSGEQIDADGPESVRRAASRRIAERLAAMDGEELRTAVLSGAGASSARAIATPTPTPTPTRTPTTTPTPTTSTSTSTSTTARTATRLGVTTLPDPEPSGRDLESAIAAELRASLRGATAAALAASLAASPGHIETALQSLAAKGAAVLRGTRWFTS